jgi:hypothetical protein
MALYSRSRGWVSRPQRPIDTGPNPYDPASRHYAERHRQSETAMAGGMVRVDVGEPVPRLAGEPAPKVSRAPAPVALDPEPEPSAPEVPLAHLRRPYRHPGEFKPGIGKG